MVFVSLLSIALLCTFGSTVVNLRSTYRTYLNDYGNIDEQISTRFCLREDLLSFTDQVEEVDKADARITLDAYLHKDNGRTIVSRIFSFNEEQNHVFKRYVLNSVQKDPEKINISICRKFAKNNNIVLGQTIELGYFNTYIPFYVNEIVETPEGIYPRANDYIWSDNQDFGYLYVDEIELNKGLLALAQKVIDKISNEPGFKEQYEAILKVAGITMPDLRTIDENFVSMFANQTIVRNKSGNGSDEIMNKITSIIESKGIKIKTKTIGENLPYRLYMSNALKQLTVATIFLPVFFYSVTMVVIGLFINQIIKSMTSQIGVMMSIGIDKKQIVVLFLVFSLFMALAAGLLGSFAGYALNILMASILITTYSIPTITSSLYATIVVAAVVGLVIFSEITTLISCSAIFRITPKDAVISNEAKRKNLPKWLSKTIDKSPMNIKLGVNSIAQNPRRFFVSTFSIFASLVLILLSSFFFVSKEEMIDQSTKRRLSFDCQVYLTQRADEELITDLKSQPFIKDMEDCYYTYLKADNADNSIYVECLAIDMNAGKLIQIPSQSGYGEVRVKENGLILSKTDASRLGVKKGQTVLINNQQIEVTDISYQYFHPIAYMSKGQMDALNASNVVSSFLVNVTSEEAFLNYLTENNNQCLTVFTHSLSTDLHAIFNAVNIFIYIMIGFSLGMGFIILCIMSQNTLMEQQRQISVMRAIGFTVMDVSNLWTLQSVSQLIIAAILAIPTGVGVAMILFNFCSSPSQIYPFILDWRVILVALGFVFLVVVACHLISMLSMKRWNLADNTRCRE